MILYSGLNAQSASDYAIIRAENFEDHRFSRRHIHFLASKSSSPMVKYNPATLFFGSLMYFYQAALSPQISAQCRFQLSCSGFSRSAIREFGMIKGVALSADRIMKCNRIAVTDAKPGEFDGNFLLYDDPSKYRIRN